MSNAAVVMNGGLAVCALEDILSGAGVCALIEGRQIAIFRVGDNVFALSNRDPASDANVLSRGIVGDLKGELVVASPIYKHHYSLMTGQCQEDPELFVDVFPAKVVSGVVTVDVRAPQPRRYGKRRLVVVGNGMAGMRTVEELMKQAPDQWEIVVFGAEPHGNYNRILLSPVLAGEKKKEEIFLHSPEWYMEHGVTLHMGDPVVSIDRRKRTVKSQQGVEVTYDRLLLATGSQPIVLPIPGATLPGVITFRDLADVDAMLKRAGRGRRAVVIGGGLLGLEAANGLRMRGMEVTVVHLLDTLMERQLDSAAASLLRASLTSRGIAFKMPAQTAELLGEDHVRGVRFNLWDCNASAACSSTTRCRRTTPRSTQWANASSIARSPSASWRRCGSRRASARCISRSAVSRAIAVRCRPRSSRSRASICIRPVSSMAPSMRRTSCSATRAVTCTSGSSFATTSCAAPCCSAIRARARGTRS
jgi:NAD(P)H-dependent nitrite reductase small subunit